MRARSGPTARRAWIAPIAAACWLAGCQGAPPVADDAVARFTGGTITAQALEAHIVTLPVEKRRPEDGDFVAWYQRLTRQLALHALLLEEAREAGIAEDPEHRRRKERFERQAVSMRYVEENLPPLEPIAEGELRAYYEENLGQYQVPARREVFQLFRRRQPGADLAPLVEEVAALRQRVLAGERFGDLAARYSDSESRHRDGQLGWFQPGQLPPDLDRLIFALAERVPSEPIRTAEGVHLFWVENAIEGQDYGFEEARASLLGRLRQERRLEALEALAGPPPEGSYVPQPEELATLLRSGDNRALILRLGDYTMRRAEFLAMLREAAQEGTGQPSPDLPWRLLASIRQRELIYQRALAEGVERPPGLEALLATLSERDLVQRHLDRRLAAAVDDEDLRRYHEQNRGRYSEPLRLRLAWLAVPIAADANALMATLEARRPELDAGGWSLEAAAAELGGALEILDWLTLDALRARAQMAAVIAVDLQPGRHSAPFRHGETIAMVKALERHDPQPLPFEAVVDRVRQDYLTHHGREVYDRVAEALLAAHGFTVLRDRLLALAETAGAGTAPPAP